MNSTASNQADRENELSNNVYSIAPGLPFLPTLADAIIKGKFGKNLDIEQDPLALSDAVVFLPTRRAARGLGVALLEAAHQQLGSTSIVLPRIRTIGDLDDEELLIGLDNEALHALLSNGNSPQVINPTERHLALARLIQKWALTLSPDTSELLQNEAVSLPSSASDALHMAKDLAKFMDQIETEEADWRSIGKIVDQSDFSNWWQLTLEFLKIVMELWPHYLKAGNLINPAAFRNQLIDFRISELLSRSHKGFVLAAGTTGSVPATARLLQTIRKLPEGAIVLPGLDCALPTHIIERINGESELLEESVASTHPQYGMVKLLAKLKTNHSEVIQIGEVADFLSSREKVLNSVTLPAEDSLVWAQVRQEFSDDELHRAFEKVTLIEAATEQDEALAIALALREALEHPAKTAALVTPDRNLAKRVSAELEKFNIQIDDTAGEALSASKAVCFVRQLIRTVFGNQDRVSFSSLLKNDLLLLGRREKSLTNEMELLELLLVRETIHFPNLNQLASLIALEEEKIKAKGHHPDQLKQLDKTDWQTLRELAATLSQALSPLTELADRKKPILLSELINALKKTVEPLTINADNEIQLFERTGGEELEQLFTSHATEYGTGFNFEPYEAPSVFDAIISGNRTRKIKRTRSRLHIYGTLEARLQSSDMIIIAGLNEGNWPAKTQNDPFLNRPMRSHLGLPLPERRIGLAAHDFTQLSGCHEVIYTRSLREGDAPSIASRWLQRLKTFLGEAETGKLAARGEAFLSIARDINQSESVKPSLLQPTPTPPVSARPNSLSITEIETWIRDPYAIYAKHVLRLRALKPIEREADPALRGTIYHEILARFVETWRGGTNKAAMAHIADTAELVFAKNNLPPDIRAAWEPRFLNIAKGFLAWETQRQNEIQKSYCEIELKGEVNSTGFVLRGIADRIDLRHDGSLEIIDYKTGSYPNKKQARLFAPQLSLEGAMASRGYARGIKPSPVSKLLYVRLWEKEKFQAEDITSTPNKKEAITAEELAEKAYEELTKHISAYQNQSQPYVSQYAPQPNKSFAGDYDHLARIKEWSLAEDENDEGDI